MVILNCSDHHVLLQIQDTGIGMADSEQRQIFDRFYRVNSDRSRNTGGSGLGLAIAQAIVQAHHGSLQVQSVLGKGSTFTIRLPLEVGSPKSDREALLQADRSSFFKRLYRLLSAVSVAGR